MSAFFTCECQDGRTITGSSQWDLDELRQMEPLQLADVLQEVKAFARYYSSTFYYPIQAAQQEATQLKKRFERAKNGALIVGIFTCVCTVLWLLMAAIPFLRYSTITLCMAVLTFFSIVVFIPFLFVFISAQEDYHKRYPRTIGKLERLQQKQEQEIFGTYTDYLISGHLVTPEYSLCEEALEFMIQALNSKRASNVAEAALLYKKQFGASSVPRIITSLRGIGGSLVHKEQNESQYRQVDLTKMESQGPDLRAVLQLSDYLHAALRSFASEQRASSDEPDSISATLTMEEEALVAEYRTLNAEEKKRIRRVVHSFYKKQY